MILLAVGWDSRNSGSGTELLLRKELLLLTAAAVVWFGLVLLLCLLTNAVRTVFSRAKIGEVKFKQNKKLLKLT